MALYYAIPLFSASQYLRVYSTDIFPTFRLLHFQRLITHDLQQIAIMLSYPFTASSQPTNPASQNLNRGLLSRELKNELRCLKFTLRLPLVEIDESIPNGAKCIICKEFYGQSFQIRGPELGCQLPCKCIIGHLCAWRYFAPFEGAHVTCPVCHMKFSELANDGGVSCPTPDFSRQNHEEAANNQLKQLEIAT